MENQIVGSQFKLLGTTFCNSNVSFDLGSFLGLVILGLAIFSLVKYLRDKNCVDYCADDFKNLAKRLDDLESKQDSISKVYKSVQELKKLISKAREV